MAFVIEFNNLNRSISDSSGLLPQISNPTYQEIIRRVQTRDGPVTKSKKGYIGCKYSQVVHTLICLIWKPELNGEVSPRILLYIVKFVILAYDKCMTATFANRALYEFINNNPTYMNGFSLDDTNLELVIDPSRSSFFPMALVLEPSAYNIQEYPHGTVSHFFTIIKRDSGFIILSSYGSNCVTVPQKEIPLELPELLECIQALANQHNPNTQIKQEADRVVTTFMQKYFLSGGEGKLDIDRHEVTGKKTFKSFNAEEGAELESQYYTRTFHQFVYYAEYADLVRRNAVIALGEMQHVGGNKYLRRYRRTKRVKRTRRNKNKTKKSRKNRK
jgi:hypothetical protein